MAPALTQWSRTDQLCNAAPGPVSRSPSTLTQLSLEQPHARGTRKRGIEISTGAGGQSRKAPWRNKGWDESLKGSWDTGSLEQPREQHGQGRSVGNRRGLVWSTRGLGVGSLDQPYCFHPAGGREPPLGTAWSAVPAAVWGEFHGRPGQEGSRGEEKAGPSLGQQPGRHKVGSG